MGDQALHQPIRIGILASHGGSNMRAIVAACRAGSLSANPALILSNNRNSKAFEWARANGLPTAYLSAKTHPDPATLDQAMLAVLQAHRVSLVALAGYMKLIGPATLAGYRNRIVNVHPALLPRHGGQGMYGTRVHAAVLAAGDRETGVTIHLVTADYDRGPIIAQLRVSVLDDDSVERLAERVLACEHRFYSQVLQRIATDEIDLDQVGS